MLQKKVSYRFLNENQAIQNVSIETMLSSSEIKNCTVHYCISYEASYTLPDKKHRTIKFYIVFIESSVKV